MPQKSDARHELERLFPGAFHVGVSSYERGTIVAFEDGLQSLKPLGSGTLDTCNESCRLRFADDIIANAKKSAESTLCETSCSTYFIVFDKVIYVPIVKGHEQRKRDDSKVTASSPKESKKKPEPDRTPSDGIGFKQRRPYLVRGQPIPRDLKLAIGDRDDTLPHIISCMCMEWANPGSELAIVTPKFKRVIIDGHGLTLEMARWCKIGGKYPANDEEAYQTPILIGDPFEHSYDKSHARWFPALRNQHGETDFAIFFHMSKMEKMYSERLHAEIYTTDTDLINLSLIYLDGKGANGPQIYWRYTPNLCWIYYSDKLNDEQCKWVDANHLHKLISDAGFDRMALPGKKKAENTRKRFEEAMNSMSEEEMAVMKRGHDGERKKFMLLKHPLMSFVATVLAVKTDYTDAFKGVTHEKFIAAMMMHSDYIGDIVSISNEHTYGISLNGDSYVRLLKTAYMLSKPARFRKDDSTKDEILHPGLLTLESVRSATSSLAYQFMSDEAISQAAQHLRYLLILYHQVGRGDRLIEPDPRNYGYYPIDPNRPMDRSNIRRGGL